MGEIKSTLDLVMERTRHLSMSAEEKEAQRREDFAKRLQGLLQHYADEAQPVDRLMEALDELQAEMQLSDRQPAIRAVKGRIAPDRENEHWMALMERLAPGLCAPLQALLEAHRQKEAQCLQAARETMAAQLAGQYAITGSAAVPNPRRDAAARRELAALREETRTAIDALGETGG